MDYAARSALDNLSLSNLNQKMKMLRDQLRQGVKDDLHYLRNRIENFGTSTQENGSVRESHFYQDRFAYRDTDGEYNQPYKKLLQNVPGQNPAYSGHIEQTVAAQPQYYRYLTLVERQIDFEQIKSLNSKNFSAEEARTYIKCVLSQDLWQKLEQLWVQYQDEQKCVEMKSFVNRLFRLSLHYIEAVGIQIPQIKKKVSLKKVLFQLAYKHKVSRGQKIRWEDFKRAIENYKYQSSPTIDVVMSQIQHDKERIPKNHLIISQQVLGELKNIYRRCSAHHFLSYCSSAALIAKIQTSRIMQMHMDTEVRRKSHLQASKTIKEIVSYMKQKSPHFIDLDQFILCFSTYPFAYYPIQEKEVLDQNQIIERTKAAKIQRIKSLKNLKSEQKQKRINKHLNTLDYYYQTKKDNQQRALLQKQENEAAQLQYRFKARPMPKSLSDEKYREFLNTLQHKKQQMRNKQLKSKEKSQKILERMKSQTKLLQAAPKHRQPEIVKKSFKARPVPEQLLESKLKDIQAQKKQRKIKILSLTEQKYTQSWQQLPYVATQRERSPKKQQPRENVNTEYHYFRQIPDYKAEQHKITEQLEERKKKFKPTKIQQFYLQTQHRHPETHCKHKTEYYHPQPAQYHQQEYDYKKIIYSPEPEIYYTQKYTEMVAANKNRAFQRELSLNKKLQQEEERQKKHQNFAKFMKVPLSKIPNTAKICELQGKAKIERHKKYWKKLDAEYQNDLNQLYAKVIKRPFLYEMQSNYGKANKQELSPQYPQKKKKKTKNKAKISQTRYKDNQVMNRSF